MKYLDTIIEKGIIGLLIFTPLAFGTVQDWSIAVMELACFIIFGAWLVKLVSRAGGQGSDIQAIGSRAQGDRRGLTPQATIFLLLAALLLFIGLQLVPMPPGMLSALSPATSSLYDHFGERGNAAWRTISINPYATKEELYRLLAYAAIFMVVSGHYRTRERITGLARAIVWMGGFLAIFAVAQKMTWNGKLFWIYPIDEALRPLGPYINRNHFAGYMEMAIPLALGLLLYRSARLTIRGNAPFKKRLAAVAGSDSFPALALLFLAALIMSGALFFSLSRGGMIGFAASMIVFMRMTRSRKALRKRSGLIALAGLAIFVVVVLAGWGRIEDRFEELGNEGNISRLAIWEDTVKLAGDFPVWGTGFGTFGDAFLRYQSRFPGLLIDHAHNDYAEVLADLGATGFVLVVGLFFTAGRLVAGLWREKHGRFAASLGAGGFASCAAMAVHSFTDFNLHIPANALLFTVIAAATFAAVRIQDIQAGKPAS